MRITRESEVKWHRRSRDEVIRDLDSFLREFQVESDRGCALLGAALISERLREILEAFLADTQSSKRLLSGFNAPLQSQWARAEAAHSLGLLSDDERENVDLVRRIRNEFAHHSHGLTFESDILSTLCGQLSAGFVIARTGASPEEREQEAREAFGSSPRNRFEQAVITLLVHLMYRAHFVEKDKRRSSQWPIGVEVHDKRLRETDIQG